MAGSDTYFSEKHKFARYWAEQGFAVFPLSPNSKIPIDDALTFRVATTDPAKIDEWWRQYPDANIGVSPDASGCYILDVDVKKGKDGAATLRKLAGGDGSVPDTFAVGTPSGGLHLWFRGHARSTVQRLGTGLDTRGIGGYGLLPGSTVDGERYVTLRDTGVCEPPEWLTTALRNSITEARSERAVTEEVDLPANIARAVAYLKKLEPIREGDGADARTYETACMLRDMALSEITAIGLLLEHYPCYPRDDRFAAFIARKVTSAYKYAQNEEGSKAVRDPGTVYASVSARAAPAPDYGVYYPRDETEQNARPEPQWAVPGWFQQQSTAMMFGPPGSGKSFIALDIALSFAAGFPLFNLQYNPAPVDVVYAAGEGVIGLEKLRRPAWRSARMVRGGLPFYTVSAVPMVRDPHTFVQFCEAIDARGVRPGLIVLDTVSRMMAGLNENDQADASRLIEAVEALRDRYQCVILCIHHTGKSGEAERGSSVFRGDFDALYRINPEERLGLTVECVKQKDAEAPEPLFMRARHVGNSLVYDPVKRVAHDEAGSGSATVEKADYQRAEIGKLLRTGGHFGLENSVTTKVLASDLLTERGTLPTDPSAAERAVELTVQALVRLARTRLAGYVVSEPGAPLRWALPST